MPRALALLYAQYTSVITGKMSTFFSIPYYLALPTCCRLQICLKLINIVPFQLKHLSVDITFISPKVSGSCNALCLTLSRATAQYCATATCTNDHCMQVFSYTTNIFVANNTLRGKYLFLVTFAELLMRRAFLATRKRMRDTVIFNWLRR